MSTNLIINEQTNIRNDKLLNTSADLNNEKLFDYNFLPSIFDSKNNNRSTYFESTNTPGLLQDTNYDLKGNNINESTILRNSNIQDNKSKRELDTRLFPGSPLLSTGQSVLKNPDLSSRLKYGEDTRTSKSANLVSSYSANNFIPLVPSIEENVQNIDHIIPTFWVRGGMSTRSVIRNIDYLKSCGINK